MRRLSATRYVPILLGSLALMGCEGTSNPELIEPDPTPDDLQVATNTQSGNPLLGAWLLARAEVGDDEIPLGDFEYVLTFWDDGTFSVSVSNDLEQWVCKDPPQTSCTWSGTYTYTRTTITFDDRNHPDPDERSVDTGLYTPCAGKLIYMDDPAPEGGSKLTFQRTRQDCYVRDCT